MSMFKTLQSNPGTVSLFKATPAIFDLLKIHQAKIVKQSKPQKESLLSKIINGTSKTEEIENYTIQEEIGKPTWDQVKLIKSYIDSNPDNVAVFQRVFPLFVRDGGKVEISQDLFKSVEKQDWFKPPLIVDWEKSIIADDLESVSDLLKSYE